MQKKEKYLSHLMKMYDLCSEGEGCVLSYIKRNMLRFDEESEQNSYFIRAFGNFSFSRVLKEMGERGMDFKNIKKEGVLSSDLVLDDYLERVKKYDEKCLNAILEVGNYTPEELAKSYIKVCQLHKKSIENNDDLIECKHLEIVTDSFLKKGMDFSCLTSEGEVPFYALCELYDVATTTKGFKVPESYEKMLHSCIHKGLESGVDLNIVDAKNKTAFSYKNKKMVSAFIRHQKIIEDKRLLDLFLILDQLAKGAVEPELVTKMQGHIKQLQSDILNGQKRLNIR